MRWNNRSGELTLTFNPADEDLAEELAPYLLDKTEATLTIHFLSSGYYDSGCTSGPPENCYPPEGEDERILDWIEADGQELPQDLAARLFEKFQDKVDALEMELPEYEPPERDDF